MEPSIKSFYCFSETDIPPISIVGGKGYSLIHMTRAGMQVPPGFVLGVNFFSQWVEFLKTSEYWSNILKGQQEKENIDKKIQDNLNQMKNLCHKSLVFSTAQRTDLHEAMTSIRSSFKLYAVRSSSPEEDLEGASFAGGYETILGVNYENLEHAILKTFASCLDYRVFKYKKEKGFRTDDFKIAIVIMAQIASEISGVGFSLNPVNNDYDEAVITSNWGLGETVVGGVVSPDEYILNKVTMEIIEVKIGKKEKSISIVEDGGTKENENEQNRSKEQTLTKDNLQELLTQIIRVENYYNKPVDIEWAIEDQKLYLLQARPITAYCELPWEMKTLSERRRNLYADMTLIIQGFDKPMSTLGSTVLKEIFQQVGLKVFGTDKLFDLHNGLGDVIGGKLYINISNAWAKIDKNTHLEFISKMNPACAKILSDSSPSYINPIIPSAFNISKLGMAWRLPITKLLFPNFMMSYTRKNVINNPQYYLTEKERLIGLYQSNDISFRNLIESLAENIAELLRGTFIPIMFGGLVCGYNKIMSLFENYMKLDTNIRTLVNDLVKSHPENVTTKMGLEMYKVSQSMEEQKEIYQSKDFSFFIDDFNQHRFPDEFYRKFNQFISQYGFRGEGELDIKSPRFEENQNAILIQIYNMLINSNSETNPVTLFETAERNRPSVYEKLLQFAEEKNFKKEFTKAYELYYNLGGFRETPKFYIISGLSSIRKIVLRIADILKDNGLIQTPDQIFDLTFQNLVSILESDEKIPKESVDAMIHKSIAYKNIFSKWPKTPPIIDSRGRILSLKPQPAKPGELVGHTVSWGTVKGRVKVMHSVNEKQFSPGDILVTKATDPGWTPLIINAGGIVLEIGGMLQHGALVSREFGKPCVVGIENVTNLLQDGELVEVDAESGIVRKIAE